MLSEQISGQTEGIGFLRVVVTKLIIKLFASFLQTFKQEWCEVFNMNAPPDAN